MNINLGPCLSWECTSHMIRFAPLILGTFPFFVNLFDFTSDVKIDLMKQAINRNQEKMIWKPGKY